MLFRDHLDKGRFIQETSVWSSLNHPHVAKFLGACYVGDRLFIVHERVCTLSEYLSKMADRQDVWRRLYEIALSLQYLHERGLSFGGKFSLENAFCAEFESKAMLFGVGLVARGDYENVSPSQADSKAFALFLSADVDVLCVLIANCLWRMSSTSTSKVLNYQQANKDEPDLNTEYKAMPATRPDFIVETEWAILSSIRVLDVSSSALMLHVIELIKPIAGIDFDHDGFDDSGGLVDKLTTSSGAIHIGSVAVAVLGSRTVGDILSECGASIFADGLLGGVHSRLAEIFEQMSATDLRDLGIARVERSRIR